MSSDIFRWLANLDSRIARLEVGETITPGAPGGAHNVLSLTHTDTLAAAVLAGDLAIGNDTSKWSRLAITVPAAGMQNYLGVSNAETKPSWKSASSVPGAAAAVLASSSSGYLQLVRLGLGVAPSDRLHVEGGHIILGPEHTDAGDTGQFQFRELAANGTAHVGFKAPDSIAASVIWVLPSADGTPGQALVTSGAGVLSWASPTPAAHNLLSASHGDALADSVARGDVLIGNDTPKWARLAKGLAYAVLTGDGADTAWSTYLLSGTAGGKTTFAVTNAKTLTLTAADSYNLTIPATGTAVLGTGTQHQLIIWSGTNSVVGLGSLGTTGQYLRSGGAGANPAWATIPAGEIGVGTAQYQYIVTGASPFTPAWSTGYLNITATKTLAVELDSIVNQDLTTDAGPSFEHLHLTQATPASGALITPAESWIGPSAMTGVYFKGGKIGLGTITPVWPLDVKVSTTITVGGIYGIASTVEFDPSADSSAYARGARIQAWTTTGNARDITGDLLGVFGNAYHDGTGTLSNAYGLYFDIYKGNTGPITNAYGVHVAVHNTNAIGAIANAYGLFIADFITTGVITNRWGVYQEGATEKNYFAGTVGIATINPQALLHAYGGIASGLNEVLRISGGAAATGSGPSVVFHERYGGDAYPTWKVAEIGAVYSGVNWGGDLLFLTNSGGSATDTSEKMRLTRDGSLGIGVSPTARLHLPAGTATANTAPIKLTSGVALAAIEDGALEYHSSHLFFSIGAVRYQLDQQTGVAAHNLLSGSHSDTAAAAAVRGDIITAQGASPLFSRLPFGVAYDIVNFLGFYDGEFEPHWMWASSNPGTDARALASNASGYFSVVRIGLGVYPPTESLDVAGNAYVHGGNLFLGPVAAGAGNTGHLEFRELVANGTNVVGFKSPDSIAANVIWTLPGADGSAGTALVTSGAGVLSWAAPAPAAHKSSHAGGGSDKLKYARQALFYVSGDLAVGGNQSAEILYRGPTATITRADGHVKTAPTDSDLIFDININSATIWSIQANRLTIAAAATSGTQTTFNTTTVTDGQIITVDVDQVGSTIPGANATVLLELYCDVEAD